MNERSQGFARNVLLLASGTVVSQAISLLGAPITARLFSAEAFGVAAVFAALIGLVLPIVCLRYESAILLPENDEDAINVLGLSLSVVLLSTAVTGIALLFLHRVIVQTFHAPELYPFFWMVPISVFTGGTYLSLTMWSIRKKLFGFLTCSQIVNAAAAVTMQVSAGLTGHLRPGWLIGPTVAATILATLVLAVRIGIQSGHLFTNHLRFAGIWHALRRYERFPRFSSISSVMNGISWQLPPFFLSTYFSQDVVGQFALGNRVIRAPMNLIGSNIAKVFAQRAAEAKHSHSLAQTVEKVFRHLVALTLFPCLLLSIMGKDLFIVVFSAKWAEAGVYSQILSAWVCVWFISSPLSLVFVVLEEQKLEFWINLLIFTSRFVSLLVGCWTGSPRAALGLFAASGVLVYGYYCLAILTKAGVPLMNATKIIVEHLLIFAPAGATVLAVKALSWSPIAVLLISCALLIVYGGVLTMRDAEVRNAVTGMLHVGPQRTRSVQMDTL